MGLQKNMKFEKFWDKLQHLEEFKPKLIDLDKMDSGEMKLLLEYKMNWAYDDYTFPVVFETLSKNIHFGVSRRKRYTKDDLFESNVHWDGIKIFRNHGWDAPITKRHFEEIWNKAKNLVKNHKDPFKQVNYKIIGKIHYDYLKGCNTLSGYPTPNHELEADGWKEEKHQKIKSPSHLSYILPIMKHLLGDEIIE